MHLSRLVLCLLWMLALGLAPIALAQPAPAQPAGQEKPRNIIILIADGAGYTMLDAVRFWSGKPLAMDGAEWTRLALGTHALRGGKAFRSELGALEQDPGMRYDPRRLYETTPIDGERRVQMFELEIAYPRAFAGYELLRRTASDSAATATAMMSGVVTFNGAINVDGARQSVETAPEIARRAGKRIGVVSSVPWTHATPACAGGAHNVERGKYHEISREMLSAGIADVLIGAGNPDYNDSGQTRSAPDNQFYAADDWQALKAGTRQTDSGETWVLLHDLDVIQALATGDVPARLVVVPRVGWTLQQRRRPPDHNGDGRHNGADAFQTVPGQDPPNPGLPTLVDLARAGLNAVDDDPDGFFLMIEGGAVDWAMHDNQLGRAIEEYLDFNAAVQLVINYLDSGTNGHNWDNTLVIVTADHDHMLYGPDADKVPFQELEDRGAGKMPGYRWLSNSHGNSLVPLFARGPGSARLIELADEMDAVTIDGRQFGRGAYLHQAEMGALLKQLVGPSGR